MARHVDINGNQFWRNSQDQLHRTDGLPAVIWLDGSQFWYRNHQHHRIDGPAVIRADGQRYWYINGQHITDEVEEWLLSHEITWPWDSSTQTLFVLTFGV